MISSIATSNPFFKMFVDSVMSSTPLKVFLNICNRVEVFKAYNVSLSDTAFVAALPNGDYKFCMRTYDSIDPAMMDFSVFCRVTRTK